ncbi:MAG TPA: hypothetical protein VGN61_16265, partial [Verrucomicrobiae bacterium]
FYTEELWRGKAAWESCRRALEAKGIDFEWAHYFPAPVPEGENIFAVPKMKEWFVGRGATELSKKAVAYPGLAVPTNGQYSRLEVAYITIELPTGPARASTNVLRWDDPNARAQALRLIKEVVGPIGFHPGSSGQLLFTPRSLDDIHPAQITLQCQSAPTTNDLSHFLPQVGEIADTTAAQSLEIEPQDQGYRAMMRAPDSAETFLKWSEQFEPEFTLIHEAVQRPYVRMPGEYDVPENVSIPNFVSARAFVQLLSAESDCHLLQTNPGAALMDLTLVNDLCRIFTNRPITLVGSMINVAVRNLYAGDIAHGLRWHAWREPQLAALEEQLKNINVIAAVHESLHMEPVAGCENLQTIPTVRLFKLSFQDVNAWEKFKVRCEARLMPCGWIYQNMIVTAQRAAEVDAWMYPIDQAVFPQQVETDTTSMTNLLSTGRPYTFLAAAFIPNFKKAVQRTALTQTKVRHAMIACALERYQLAHGDYPETLDALVPQFIESIPNDVIGGKPPHYRRSGAGTYVLYSIGWSGQDGGGVSKPNDTGDWIWPEPD